MQNKIKFSVPVTEMKDTDHATMLKTLSSYLHHNPHEKVGVDMWLLIKLKM